MILLKVQPEGGEAYGTPQNAGRHSQQCPLGKARDQGLRLPEIPGRSENIIDPDHLNLVHCRVETFLIREALARLYPMTLKVTDWGRIGSLGEVNAGRKQRGITKV
jgi:hypothetical protein